MTELETYFRDRSAGDDPNAGAFAVAYAVLRLSNSIDGLTRTFAPHGFGSLETDYFLVRLAHRIDGLSKQLRSVSALAAHLVGQDGGTDPPEAVEFLSRRRRRESKTEG